MRGVRRAEAVRVWRLNEVGNSFWRNNVAEWWSEENWQRLAAVEVSAVRAVAPPPNHLANHSLQEASSRDVCTSRVDLVNMLFDLRVLASGPNILFFNSALQAQREMEIGVLKAKTVAVLVRDKTCHMVTGTEPGLYCLQASEADHTGWTNRRMGAQSRQDACIPPTFRAERGRIYPIRQSANVGQCFSFMISSRPHDSTAAKNHGISWHYVHNIDQ
ncbi:hypothetical protein ST47_g6033 [Ascochyta rabiei]|uniref:Uncharacterized protein n=1 Tax=Didymella rabiei TaxID=5454 RepID=A0A163D0G8_DIDRA|nr:hypothetical protein ST47_g6033 [Ascochyta rabiei]